MKNKINMGGFLKMVSIVVAAGTLVSAIFTPDEDKELDDKIKDAVEKALSEKN